MRAARKVTASTATANSPAPGPPVPLLLPPHLPDGECGPNEGGQEGDRQLDEGQQLDVHLLYRQAVHTGGTPILEVNTGRRYRWPAVWIWKQMIYTQGHRQAVHAGSAGRRYMWPAV